MYACGFAGGQCYINDNTFKTDNLQVSTSLSPGDYKICLIIHWSLSPYISLSNLIHIYRDFFSSVERSSSADNTYRYTLVIHYEKLFE